MSLSKRNKHTQGIDRPGAPLGCKLLVAFIVSVVAGGVVAAQRANQQPKLVVGIMVDDLRSEYLSLLRDHFGAGGFNRLINDGVVISSADYGAALDPTAATALIFTGASPSVNGIPAEEVFDRATLHGIPVLTDPTMIGNYTSQTFSPADLAVTTIADEVKVAGGGGTFVYSVAPNPADAVIMAGHAGNCGVWINNANSNWATTTYYKDPPSTLNLRNHVDPLRARIDTITWAPLKGKEAYSLLPEHLTVYPFKYTFRHGGPDKMGAFNNSPKVNEEVTAFAIDNITQLRLGQHDGPDMLSVAYTLEPYAYAKRGDNRYELIDSYYRLDRNLEQLFSAIDKSVGLDKTVVFLAATPPAQRTKRDEERWQLPYGEFSTRKAISLLNLYLMAKFGNGQWVHAYHNGQFFLNHKLIEEQKQDLETLRTETARFLEMMAGVTTAYTIDEIVDCTTREAAQRRNSVAVNLAGDVFVEVMPGWQIVDDYNNAKRSDKVERATASTAPVFIMAPNVPARKIEMPVDARSIAPTITRLLRIRSPNAAGVAPLDLEP